MTKKKSTKREAARRKRNARGWTTRRNRSPGPLAQEGADQEPFQSVSTSVPVVPPIDAPAPRSLLERVPPVVRWIGLVTVALVIGTLVATNHTVKLGATACVATLLAGGAFLVAFLPPSLRERPGDGAAVGFGRATGHARPAADDAAEEDAPPNRAARRRARKEQK